MANARQAPELARRYIETLGAGRIEECMSLFRDDAVVIFPRSLSGQQRVSKEDFRASFRRAANVFEAWPRYTLLHQTSEANRSCIEFNGIGKLKNGKKFDSLYCLVFVAEGGLITELREYLDTHYMLAVLQGADAKDAV